MQNIRLDLHTHSIISYDGGIADSEYGRLAMENFCMAVTDHNDISRAIGLRRKFGEKIIVGEEILAKEGEIIGLFLENRIEPNQNLLETVKKIKEQNGLVYVPHPLESFRKGLSMENLNKILPFIDILEVYNARLRSLSLPLIIEKFANRHGLAKAAASDAHGARGIGSSFTIISEPPTKDNLISLLKNAELVKNRASWLSYLDPAKNKIKKGIYGIFR